jgi:DNA-binding GntR family transcriptional regulator
MGEKILLTHKTYESLKEDIINLRFKEDSIITEKELAEKYKVSKTPVREALKKLNLEGFIEVLPHKGYFITSISVEDLKNIFQMRMILEVGASEIAIANAGLNDIEKLKEIASTKVKKINSKSYIEYSEINYQFHLLIAQSTKNNMLVNTIKGLLNQLRRVLYKDLHNLDFEKMKNEHLKIVDAIEKKDISLAKKIMEKHLLDAKKRIFE